MPSKRSTFYLVPTQGVVAKNGKADSPVSAPMTRLRPSENCKMTHGGSRGSMLIRLADLDATVSSPLSPEAIKFSLQLLRHQATDLPGQPVADSTGPTLSEGDLISFRMRNHSRRAAGYATCFSLTAGTEFMPFILSGANLQKRSQPAVRDQTQASSASTQKPSGRSG